VLLRAAFGRPRLQPRLHLRVIGPVR